jgi:hypothetical protein
MFNIIAFLDFKFIFLWNGNDLLLIASIETQVKRRDKHTLFYR